jgi:Zn-dependent protease with chaperone function
LLVDYGIPAAYCLPGGRPGRRQRVVVTTAALRLLDDDQLDKMLG